MSASMAVTALQGLVLVVLAGLVARRVLRKRRRGKPDRGADGGYAGGDYAHRSRDGDGGGDCGGDGGGGGD
ncbi:hypothetical protein [Methylopila turkensis]|uniref:hypothetical protein n=1 Tax=Methylopila turkensis TaxID=1437816 RepID=UPI0022F334E7|nr:hypothetical protein [Methylopila turkensis]